MPTQTDDPIVIPLSANAHLEGCPAKRIEHWEAIKPGKENHPEKIVTVVRCGDCAGQEVHDGNIARVSRKLSENGDRNGREGKQVNTAAKRNDNPEQ